MKFYLVPFLFCISCNALADLTIKSSDSIKDILDMQEVKDAQDEINELDKNADPEATQKNYITFKYMLYAYFKTFKDLQEKDDKKIQCSLQEIVANFMNKNIKYANQFDKDYEGKITYIALLEAINKDLYNNKEACNYYYSH